MKQKPIHPAMQPFLDGRVILINKPLRWTSFDAVKKVRIATGITKVGHAGTLDPLATGLLIICTGKFTKRINEYMGWQKEYTGTITIGATTPTFDKESEPENHSDYSHLTERQIKEATTAFIGEIEQYPPLHSAVKKDGKRLYEYARKGQQVEVEARKVTIEIFEITSISLPEIQFRVVCSTGTYIRSLANDFGHALGTGGYLSNLCRTRIGKFELSDAQSPDEFDRGIREMKHQNGNPIPS